MKELVSEPCLDGSFWRLLEDADRFRVIWVCPEGTEVEVTVFAKKDIGPTRESGGEEEATE